MRSAQQTVVVVVERHQQRPAGDPGRAAAADAAAHRVELEPVVGGSDRAADAARVVAGDDVQLGSDELLGQIDRLVALARRAEESDGLSLGVGLVTQGYRLYRPGLRVVLPVTDGAGSRSRDRRTVAEADLGAAGGRAERGLGRRREAVEIEGLGEPGRDRRADD